MARIGGSTEAKIPFATPASTIAKVTVTNAPQQLEGVKSQDVSVFFEARHQRLQPESGRLGALIGKLFQTGTAPTNEADRRNLLANTGQLAREVIAALSNGVDTSDRVKQAATVFGRIEQVLALEDPPVLNALPADVRKRLEQNLFGPLKELRQNLGVLLESVSAPALRVPESDALVTTPHDVKAGEAFALRRAGNVETRGIETFETATVKVAAFTNKGIGYASYDEDGLSFRVVPGKNGKPERVIAAVADQAGGEDHLSKDGLASETALNAWEDAVVGGADEGEALHQANTALGQLNAAERKRGVTTLSGITLEGDKARIASAGDSQVLIFSRDGKLKGRSTLDNYGADLWAKGNQSNALRYASSLTNSLGTGERVTAHIADLKVAPGDLVLLFSDGIGDMNLEAQQRTFDNREVKNWPEWHTASTEREIGEYIATGASPEEIARSVITNAFANVRSGDGKPDNTTLMVMEIKSTGA